MNGTAYVRYVFLDTVEFTKKSVEAQSDVVEMLNTTVISALEAVSVSLGQTILIPTGDGIAIALTGVADVDVHLRLALEILRLIAKHNATTDDSMRRFEVRIGINENHDNLVVDVNGKQNVAGLGISMAQRIMDKADGGQILVGHSVFEVLRGREKYLSSFRRYEATGKHGITFSVHQFVADDAQGLSTSAPSAFSPKQSERPQLSKFAAYYIAHAVVNRDLLSEKKDEPMRDYVGVVLLAFLADDSIDAEGVLPQEEPMIVRTWGAGSSIFEEQFEHYLDTDFWVLAELASSIESYRLSRYSECFERGAARNYAFVSPVGIQRLHADWPGIAKQFGIEPTITTS